MFFKGAISADSHIVEPPHCYVDFIEPKYRDVAPHIARQPNGQDLYVIKDLKQTIPLGMLDGAGMTCVDRRHHIMTTKFEEMRRSGWDPKYRVTDQERDGVAAELLYASVGMVLCSHPDTDYKAACMQAYNRWLETYCGEAPDRLFGLAMTPVLSVESAIEDFRRAKAMGFVGMMMPGNPIHEDYDHPDYDALWECATDLDLPLCFHILTGREGSIKEMHAPRRGGKINGFMGIIRAVQDVVGVFVLGGVFERHPRLKLVCAEADAGWLAHYMYRMDHAAFTYVDDGIIKGLSKLPSAYIRSNVWCTFQDDWVAFQTKDLVNFRQLIWANDFPHTDSTWPRSQELLAKQAAHLSEEERAGILRDNVRALFNLPVGGQPLARAAE